MDNNIKIRCANKHCLKEINYDGIKKHKSDCDNIKRKCYSCNKDILYLDYDSHLSTCDTGTKRCENCSAYYDKNDSNKHFNLLCLKSKLNHESFNAINNHKINLNKKINTLIEEKEFYDNVNNIDDLKNDVVINKLIEKLTNYIKNLNNELNFNIEKEQFDHSVNSYEKVYSLLHTKTVKNIENNNSYNINGLGITMNNMTKSILVNAKRYYTVSFFLPFSINMYKNKQFFFEFASSQLDILTPPDEIKMIMNVLKIKWDIYVKTLDEK